jgi:hypothetical protein
MKMKKDFQSFYLNVFKIHLHPFNPYHPRSKIQSTLRTRYHFTTTISPQQWQKKPSLLALPDKTVRI